MFRTTYKVIKTWYEKGPDGWRETNRSESFEDASFIEVALSDTAQPFEQSHRCYTQTRGLRLIDTYESVGPSGDEMFRVFVDFSTTGEPKWRED